MRTNFFVFSIVLLQLFGCQSKNSERTTNSVNGEIPVRKLGKTLIHEHILVDFIGADSIGYQRWDRQKVVEAVLPYLTELKEAGCQSLFECTPAYLGRDPILLKILSDSSGINIITNTGLYGARQNKFLPQYALKESADGLAKRWITEFNEGIEGTGVRPGFIKIGVEDGSLSDLHQKLITAAARTHLVTGLTIASHTGPAKPAFEQLEILVMEGVSPEAFVWVHAQAEKNPDHHIQAAQKGAWISLDGLSENNMSEYIRLINHLKKAGLFNKVLISHDAGWYSPGEENGGSFRGYTTLFKRFIPLLKKEGYTDQEIEQLIVINPKEAFSIRVRSL